MLAYNAMRRLTSSRYKFICETPAPTLNRASIKLWGSSWDVNPDHIWIIMSPDIITGLSLYHELHRSRGSRIGDAACERQQRFIPHNERAATIVTLASLHNTEPFASSPESRPISSASRIAASWVSRSVN